MRKIARQFSSFIFMKESTILRQRIDWQRGLRNPRCPRSPPRPRVFPGPAGASLASYLEASQPLTQTPHEVKAPSFLRDISKRLTNSLLFWEICFVVALVACFVWPLFAQLPSGRIAGAAALRRALR